MAKKRSDMPRSMEPPEIDDLTQIKGIGHAVEQRLHSNGIFTFSKLVGHLPGDIAELLRGLSGMTRDRIIRENWIGQAQRLAADSKSTEPQQVAEILIEPE